VYGLWNELSTEVVRAVSVNVLTNCGKQWGSTEYFPNTYLVLHLALRMNIRVFQKLFPRHKLRFPIWCGVWRERKQQQFAGSNSTCQWQSSQLYHFNSSHFWNCM